MPLINPIRFLANSTPFLRRPVSVRATKMTMTPRQRKQTPITHPRAFFQDRDHNMTPRLPQSPMQSASRDLESKPKSHPHLQCRSAPQSIGIAKMGTTKGIDRGGIDHLPGPTNNPPFPFFQGHFLARQIPGLGPMNYSGVGGRGTSGLRWDSGGA
jgi:hypothetical protein